MVDATLADINCRLLDHLDALAGALNFGEATERKGDHIRFRSRGSLRITVRGAHRGKFEDFETGAKGDLIELVHQAKGGSIADAISWARDFLGIKAIERPAKNPTPADLPKPSGHLALARAIWSESLGPHGTLTERYLNARKLQVPSTDVLRFHPRCPRNSGRLPAMVAPMTDPITNQPRGIHRTFLLTDGSGKAAGNAKMMLGPVGIIRLCDDADVTMGLGVAEGIESALACIQYGGFTPVWAVGSAGAIATFPVLHGIECLTIFVDNDDRGVGRKAAKRCAERWIEAGAEVRLEIPPAATDWHDALATS